jgi:aldose 1-epimerase
MGDAIPHLHRKHGDAYVLRENFLESPEPLRAARLVHPATGRVLEVSTTDTYLQLYTSAFLDGSLVGKSSRTYAKHGAVCLECHGYSDGANTSELGDIILRPGKPQRRATSYAFSAQP